MNEQVGENGLYSTFQNPEKRFGLGEIHRENRYAAWNIILLDAPITNEQINLIHARHSFTYFVSNDKKTLICWAKWYRNSNQDSQFNTLPLKLCKIHGTCFVVHTYDLFYPTERYDLVYPPAKKHIYGEKVEYRWGGATYAISARKESRKF